MTVDKLKILTIHDERVISICKGESVGRKTMKELVPIHIGVNVRKLS